MWGLWMRLEGRYVAHPLIVLGARVHGSVAFTNSTLCRIAVITVAVEVGEGFGVVGDHGVEVEGLGIGEIGVGDGSGNGGPFRPQGRPFLRQDKPIRAEPAAKAPGVVARTKIVVRKLGGVVVRVRDARQVISRAEA